MGHPRNSNLDIEIAPGVSEAKMPGSDAKIREVIKDGTFARHIEGLPKAFWPRNPHNHKTFHKANISKLAIMHKHIIFTLNIKTIQTRGKRQEIATYMKQHNIAIMGLQETQQQHNTRESIQGYMFFYLSLIHI
eukprot:370743-Prorocentrum_lima.AAC.1